MLNLKSLTFYSQNTFMRVSVMMPKVTSTQRGNRYIQQKGKVLFSLYDIQDNNVDDSSHTYYSFSPDEVADLCVYPAYSRQPLVYEYSTRTESDRKLTIDYGEDGATLAIRNVSESQRKARDIQLTMG